MAENPKTDILVNPKWSILQDGLGYRVLLLGGIPEVRDGVKVLILKIKADDIVRKRYNWAIGRELASDNTKEIVINENDLIPMNIYDDANRTWLYVKSFNHHSTPVSEREQFLKTKLESKEKRISLLEGLNIQLAEQLGRAKLQVGKYVTESAMVFEKATEGISKVMNKQKEGQQ